MIKRWCAFLLAAAFSVVLFAGCGGGSTGGTAASSGTAASGTAAAKTVDYSKMKIGEITSLVVNDGGWCQATHQSVLAAMKELGVPEANLKVIENVAEDQTSVTNAYNALASENVNLIFGASAGYATFLSELAAKNPGIVVAQQGDKVSGLIGYQIRNYEGMFLAGYTAALLAKSDKLGYAASMSEASVRAAINGFAMGAKYANANAKVQVVWANSWYDVDLETQSAKTLVNQGIKYMGIEASSPAIPQTCEANGAFCIGYNVNMQDLAPKAVLTSFEWNFAPIFKDIITSVSTGKASGNDYYFKGGDCAKLSAFNETLVPKDIQDKVAAVKADIASGKIKLFSGELKDNQGNVLVAAGQTMTDEKIIAQEFLVDNVIGTWK